MVDVDGKPGVGVRAAVIPSPPVLTTSNVELASLLKTTRAFTGVLMARASKLAAIQVRRVVGSPPWEEYL